MVLLTVALGGVVVIEQPGSSVLAGHVSFKHVCNQLRKLGFPVA